MQDRFKKTKNSPFHWAQTNHHQHFQKMAAAPSSKCERNAQKTEESWKLHCSALQRIKGEGISSGRCSLPAPYSKSLRKTPPVSQHPAPGQPAGAAPVAALPGGRAAAVTQTAPGKRPVRGASTQSRWDSRLGV